MCRLNFSKPIYYILIIFAIITFLFGPIMLGIHYETHIDITKPILIISWIFTGFWGLIFSILIGVILFVISFIVAQSCLEDCCCDCCLEDYDRKEYVPNEYVPENRFVINTNEIA